MLTFNVLLREAGVNPSATRLLRHSDTRHRRTPYQLWRDSLGEFEKYQAVQKKSERAKFLGTHWASFVVTPAAETLFVGLYAVYADGDVPQDWEDPLDKRPHNWADYDLYQTARLPELSGYAGRLIVDWGYKGQAWKQLAANQDKPVLELRAAFAEPAFPGFANLVIPLSDVERMPNSWRAVLSEARGIYLLTCPRTKEQYVGQASGNQGFYGRWLEYALTGHGGNIALRNRDPNDYQVSILQVAGSADDGAALNAMETLWKRKLQSREMGLNRN